MAFVAFGALAVTRDLEAAGVERRQAEAVERRQAEAVERRQAEAIATATGNAGERAASKADLKTAVERLEDRLERLDDKLQNYATRADLYRAVWLQTGAIIAAVVALVKLL